MIDVHIDANVYTIDEATRQRVTALELALKKLKTQMEKQMKFSEEFSAKMQKFDDATSEIAKDLADLRGMIGTAVPEADAKAALDRLDGAILALEAMGKEPEPVDPAEPPPVDPSEPVDVEPTV